MNLSSPQISGLCHKYGNCNKNWVFGVGRILIFIASVYEEKRGIRNCVIFLHFV